MSDLEIAMLDDAAPDEAEDDARRRELVDKILFSELGTNDFNFSILVFDTMPRVMPGEEPTRREVEEFSKFLEERVAKLPPS